MKSIFAIAVLMSAFSINVSAIEFTKADCLNFIDVGRTVENPGFTVMQRLPVGESMSATFTNKNQVIKNIGPPETTPTCSGTVGANSSGIYFKVGGFINGLLITDGIQKHSNADNDGALQFAAFVPNGLGGVESAGLGAWLSGNSYVASDMLTIPDFSTPGMDLFYGVDLSVWSTNGFVVDDSLLSESFTIINGASLLLPGLTFSTDPLSFGTSGWETSSPFSGTAILDSFHLLSADVPEPNTLALVGIATVLLVARRRNNRQK